MVPMFYQLADVQEELSVCIVETGAKIANEGGLKMPQLLNLLEDVKADDTLPESVRKSASDMIASKNFSQGYKPLP